jgi:hypothetical protein
VQVVVHGEVCSCVDSSQDEEEAETYGGDRHRARLSLDVAKKNVRHYDEVAWKVMRWVYIRSFFKDPTYLSRVR